ncbi:MAG: tetratricopeptide repeat protein [Verrucomicrobiota bacterium]
MSEDFSPEPDPVAGQAPTRRRRRKRRSIQEAHARDRRIKKRGGPPSKWWWLVPIVIGAIGTYIFYINGVFDLRQDTLAGGSQAETEANAWAVAQLNKAEEFRNAELPEKALPILNDLLEQQPELPKLAFELAHVHYELGNLEEARRYAELAMRREENIAVSNYLIGVTYCLQSRFRDALPYFETAFKNYDQSAPLLQNWADALRAVGKNEIALEKLERALAQRPNSKILQMKIALTRIDIGEGVLVRREAERDLRWTPDYIPALLIMSALELQEGKVAAAKPYLDRIQDEAGPQLLKNYLQDVYFLRYQDLEELQPYFPDQEERLKLAEQSQRDMRRPEPPSPSPGPRETTNPQPMENTRQDFQSAPKQEIQQADAPFLQEP